MTLPAFLLAVSTFCLSHGQAAGPPEPEEIALARSVIKADRQAVVADTLQLTPTESTGFWPLYHQYRAEMDKVADDLLKLAQEYGKYYPNISDDRARTMLKDLCTLEKKYAATRTSHIKRVGKVLPVTKTLRFAQVESRLDLAARLGLAANIPLVPVTK